MKPWMLVPAWYAAVAVAAIAVVVRRRKRQRDQAWAAEAAEYVREIEYLAHLEKELAGTVLPELAWMLAESTEEWS